MLYYRLQKLVTLALLHEQSQLIHWIPVTRMLLLVCVFALYWWYIHHLLGLDQSLLEEYEQRVQQRQRELEALRQEREELLQLDAMLQDLMVTQVRLMIILSPCT